MVIINTYEHSC